MAQDISPMESGVFPTADPSLPCTTPQPRATLCPCVQANDDDVEPAPSCKVVDLVPGLAYVAHGLEASGEALLVGASGDDWRVLAQLGHADSGANGVDNGWDLTGVRERAIGGHQVIEISGHQHDVDRDADLVVVKDDDQVTLCVRGGADEPPRCPVQVVVRETDLSWTVSPETGEEGPDRRWSTRRTVVIAADGMVHVRPPKGSKGPRTDVRLW